MSRSFVETPDAAPVPCGRCRKRRVKCDKRKPGCARCEAFSQPCPGYDRVRGFLDQGQHVRKKHASNAAVISSRTAPSPSHASPASVSQSPIQNTPTVDLLLSHTQSPSQATPLTSHITDSSTHESSVTTLDLDLDADFDSAFFDLDPDVYYADISNCCGFLPSVPLIDDIQELSRISLPTIDGYIPSSNSSSDSNGLPLQLMAESIKDREAQEADLIRHYIDVISPWLDVFDIEKYFGHIVPSKAVKSVLLKDSLAAVAAKQFGNMRRDAAVFSNREPTSFALGQHYSNLQVDWLYEAAGFYDKAIRQMITTLESLSDKGIGPIDRAAQPSTPSCCTAKAAYLIPNRNMVENNESTDETVDNLLIAVSIFLLYESLDNRQFSIIQHMTGAQHLLFRDFQQQKPLSPTSYTEILPVPNVIDTTRAWQASFWNFACVDYVVSYAAKSTTKLDTSDVHLWKAAGLTMVSSQGQWVPEILCRDTSTGPSRRITETLSCRSLTWIVLRTLNFVANCNPGQSDNGASNSESANWDRLNTHLDNWFATLPDSFEPCLKSAASRGYPLRYGHSPGPAATPLTGPLSTIQIPFPEVFYSNAMGAATLLLYHFTRILLLLHKPPTHESFNSRMGTQRLNAYRQHSNQINHHAEEICAIALGRPQHAVQLQLLQPLYIAGLCLESTQQRVVLADLLVGLQESTGSSTEWRLLELKEGWGWKHSSPTN